MAIEKILVPDIGGGDPVDVIEVAVSVGDQIVVEDALITLEGDKATMDIPSPKAGKVASVDVSVGDKIAEGGLIITLETEGAASESVEEPAEEAPKEEAKSEPKQEASKEPAPVAQPEPAPVSGAEVYAGPAVRRLAQEVGLNLAEIPGSGDRGRITKDDVKNYVQQRMNGGGSAGSGLGVAAMPAVDFSRFGPVSTRPLGKIQKLSGSFLHRNWVTVPHVTQFIESDITELEDFRQAEKGALAKQGIRLTPIVFIMKAVVAALKAFPHFNASLDASGQNLVLKEYFHIGVAVDTPNGLVVPVIRDVDQKSLTELAKELGDIGEKARAGALTPGDMQGGCFTISSLGGIGGTAFTPIVNVPEVAILGVSRSEMKPKWIDGEFEARLMLPLSLSYDHRVIDGADGARFAVFVSACLEDLRKLML